MVSPQNVRCLNLYVGQFNLSTQMINPNFRHPHTLLGATQGRPLQQANSHGFTVRLTVWAINSQSHDLASKSHGESENLEIAKQFR